MGYQVRAFFVDRRRRRRAAKARVRSTSRIQHTARHACAQPVGEVPTGTRACAAGAASSSRRRGARVLPKRCESFRLEPVLKLLGADYHAITYLQIKVFGCAPPVDGDLQKIARTNQCRGLALANRVVKLRQRNQLLACRQLDLDRGRCRGIAQRSAEHCSACGAVLHAPMPCRTAFFLANGGSP